MQYTFPKLSVEIHSPLEKSPLIFISRKLLPLLPVLDAGSLPIFHKTLHPRKCSEHFVYKTLLYTSKQCIFQETVFLHRDIQSIEQAESLGWSQGSGNSSSVEFCSATMLAT
jgi:hypothetical protein